MRLLTALTAIAATAALAVAASPAAAAISVGSVGDDAVTTTNTGACPTGTNCTFMGVGAGGVPLITVPAAGVVVRWQIRTGSTPPDAQVALRVLRPAGVGPYAAAGSSAAEPLTSDGVRTFETRVPVRAGDALGFDDRNDALLFADDPAATTQWWQPALAAGATSAATGSTSGKRPLLAAVIEPDADLDGYGDETQDACPANPQRLLAPCDPSIPVADLELTLQANPPAGRPGEEISMLLTVRNNGTDSAEGTVARIHFPLDTTYYPDWLTVPGFIDPRCQRPTGRVNRTRATRVCTLGTLQAGASTTVRFGLVPGPWRPYLDLSASAGSVTADPIPANNAVARRVELAPSLVVLLQNTDFLVRGGQRLDLPSLLIKTSEVARVTVGLYRSVPGRRRHVRLAVFTGNSRARAWNRFSGLFAAGAVFGNLAPGRYFLRVQAKDRGGYESRVKIVPFTFAQMIDNGPALNPVSR